MSTELPPSEWKDINPEAFSYFSTLCESRSNIYLYGLNGIGKTRFARTSLDNFIYIDCIEFYNENLICTYIAEEMQKAYDEHFEGKTFMKLKDSLLSFAEMVPNEHVYFVFDNIDQLLQSEKTTNNVEKIMIIADMAKELVNVVLIHDTFIDEMTRFGLSSMLITEVLTNYDFIPFLLEPMSTQFLKQVLHKQLKPLLDTLPEEHAEKRESSYVPTFFNLILPTFTAITNNIREFSYITTILYPYFEECKIKEIPYKEAFEQEKADLFAKLKSERSDDDNPM